MRLLRKKMKPKLVAPTRGGGVEKHHGVT